MSRKILFKGKLMKKPPKDIWCYGDLVMFHDRVFIHPKDTLVEPRTELSSTLTLHEVYRGSVGQFTGFTDMNGERIFEGDILSCQFDNLYPENITSATVAFDSGKFIIIDAEGISEELDEFVCQMSTVVGNEFDELQERG